MELIYKESCVDLYPDLQKRLSNGLHVIIFPLPLAMSEDNNISFWYTNTIIQWSSLLTLAYKACQFLCLLKSYEKYSF